MHGLEPQVRKAVGMIMELDVVKVSYFFFPFHELKLTVSDSRSIMK